MGCTSSSQLKSIDADEIIELEELDVKINDDPLDQDDEVEAIVVVKEERLETSPYRTTTTTTIVEKENIKSPPIFTPEKTTQNSIAPHTTNNVISPRCLSQRVNNHCTWPGKKKEATSFDRPIDSIFAKKQRLSLLQAENLKRRLELRSLNKKTDTDHISSE